MLRDDVRASIGSAHVVAVLYQDLLDKVTGIVLDYIPFPTWTRASRHPVVGKKRTQAKRTTVTGDAEINDNFPFTTHQYATLIQSSSRDSDS